MSPCAARPKHQLFPPRSSGRTTERNHAVPNRVVRERDHDHTTRTKPAFSPLPWDCRRTHGLPHLCRKITYPIHQKPSPPGFVLGIRRLWHGTKALSLREHATAQCECRRVACDEKKNESQNIAANNTEGTLQSKLLTFISPHPWPVEWWRAWRW